MTPMSAMNPTERREMSREILEEFAIRTGVTSDRAPARYLWTDAFAVCGFLGLFEESGESRDLETALELVDQVHHVLGRHRADDSRDGWISGLSEEEGEAHPTAGGLRIGKPEPERGAGEPYHPQREWDRDGQYYHYLTKWMHALDRVWRVTGEERFHRWAVELAGAAHQGFMDTGPGGQRRMRWKMSIDLSRPLVPSMGQHDPLDGRLTLAALQVTAPAGAEEHMLVLECRELADVCRSRSWTTDDPLGIGGLLTDCLRLGQIEAADGGAEPPVSEDLRRSVFEAGAVSLSAAGARAGQGLPAERRLAFRELGMVIGIRAARRLPEESGTGEPEKRLLAAVREQGDLIDGLLMFWSQPEHRTARSWTDHRDINAVTLALALFPDGYVEL